MRRSKFKEWGFQRKHLNTKRGKLTGLTGRGFCKKISTGAGLKTMLALVVLAAVLPAGCGRAEEAPEQESGQSREELEAAGEAGTAEQIVFEGVDMEGNTVSSSVFSEAKLTMVNVWATYCSPCLREMPDLGELAGEYDTGEFQLIGIVSDVMEGGEQEKIDLAAGLVEQTGAAYTHLFVNESLYYALLTEVSAVPTTFFIDENGVVLDAVVGAMEKDDWKEKIDELLEGL